MVRVDLEGWNREEEVLESVQNERISRKRCSGRKHDSMVTSALCKQEKLLV